LSGCIASQAKSKSTYRLTERQQVAKLMAVLQAAAKARARVTTPDADAAAAAAGDSGEMTSSTAETLAADKAAKLAGTSGTGRVSVYDDDYVVDGKH
jgi:hypothetical protein